MRFYHVFLLLLYFSCKKTSEDKKESQISNLYYDKAFEFLDNNKRDSAFYYFNLSKDNFLKTKETLSVAKSLINMAIIQENEGDNFGSQETSLLASKYLSFTKKNNHYYIATNYNNLGIVNGKLKNHNKSSEFFIKAVYYTDDLANKIIYQNNLANAFRRITDYDKALSTYRNILNEKINKKEYARILSNFSYTKWLQNPNYNPVPEFKKALNIRLKEKDNWGLNSSYSHLADYYADIQKDSALLYANKMYSVSKEIKSPDDQIEALQKLISLENPESSKQYFKVYQKLNDSLQTARSKAKNQFALIRYETEKNKADFLKAKAESAQRQNEIIKRNIGLAILILGFVYVYFWIRRRQKRHQQEKLLEVKNTELKYSKKIHDRVANRIYQIMSQVENTTVVDKNALLFGLENVYETTRDISYDNKEINENQNYYEQLHKMLDSYSSDSVKIIYNGNNENLWEDVNFHIKTEAYLILQELMTNMKKHSKADKVFLKFSKDISHINISYTDNGVGLKGHLPKNGLQNMENRINSIYGKINFDTETNNLLKINIKFPI